MRQVALLTAILLGTSGPIAHAQGDACGALATYMEGARNGFQSLRGEADGTGDFTAKINLPQANSCMIRSVGGGNFSATCNYLFIDAADRATGMQQIRRAIEKCLGWPEGGTRRSRSMSYKGVTGYEIDFTLLGKFDAQLAIEYVGP